jgi:hypothetical protein
MILQGRNLTQGASGTDVAALHAEITQLGFTVPPAELQGGQFGAGTLAAIEQAQAAAGLTANGIVDAPTASALDELIRRGTYVVSGHVTSTASAGIGGLAVRLVDKNVGGDIVLATATTDTTGGYSMSVVIGPPRLRAHFKTAPDLQTQVLESAGTTAPAIVAVSAVAISATSPLVLDIALPANAPGLLSEYETLTASLTRIYTGRLMNLKENDATQDVTYLGAKSGWDARAVAMASLADQFSTLTAPVPPVAGAASVTPDRMTTRAAPTPRAAPATAGAATTTAPGETATSLPAAFYYALFRAGVPADADTLFQTRPAAVSAIWTQATTQGVIPKSLAAAIPRAVQTFQALAGAHLLTMPPRIGISTVHDLVTPLLTGAGQPARFAALLAAHAGDWTTFWSAVGTEFGTATAKELQLTGQLAYLTLDNAPLLAALDKAEAHSPLAAPIDLATRGYWDPAKWTPLIGQSAPPSVPGATIQEKTANYAGWLAAQVRLSFPTATLAQQVRSGGIPLASAPAAASEAADFLTAHQADFAFGVEPVESYIARNKLTPSNTAVFQLKRLQRVYQMTTSDQALSALLTGDADSAYPITRYDADGFVRAFSAKVGGDVAARAIHDRARQIHGVTLNVVMSYALRRAAPGLGGASGMLWPPSPGKGGSGQTVAAATLDGLFGSLDTCGCDDCESMLSPSAYLVDLLHYLDQPATASGVNPQTILFGRRPDLQFLPLTCENTETAQAGIASKTASYQRRADEWMHQVNLAARDLMSIGRQIIGSLIAEQAAFHDYQNVRTQIQQAQEIQTFLRDKFTNKPFYDWMGSELSGLYYQYYRFACDTARRAEQTMKRELMRPELDGTQFIQFNYWDAGHQGLLSGEALHFDLRRLEMAYHDNNKRELEMTRHVSLRQLDLMALIQFRVTGTCTVTIPEWLYDRDCPGHYMRRIRSVAISIPSVVGPYASVNCTLSLQASSVRTSPLLANGVYGRDPTQDDIRFVDYFGATDVVVTSGASNDSGMFETNLHDERFLPFEGAGAISTWTLTLPGELRAFDYSTIADVILHVRYTAREAGGALGQAATKELLKSFADATRSPQALILNLKYDFPTEWAAFVNGAGASPFTATIDTPFLPYYVQSLPKTTVIGAVRAFCDDGKGNLAQVSLAGATAVTGSLSAAGGATLTLPTDGKVLTPNASKQVYVVIGYTSG